MDKFRLPSSVDFHLPSALVGTWSKHRNIFAIIKADIDLYLRGQMDLKILMIIVDNVDRTKGLGFSESMRILANLMSYIRIKLLSKDYIIIEMTAVLLDVLVKNCQYRVHIFVSRKIFMKTYCFVMREMLADGREAHRRAGVRMVDILQGWGEAFIEHRKDIYPFLVSSYEKTRYKYGIKYPRPVYDPRRVPIFLDPVNQHELDEARERRAEWMIEAAKHEDSAWGCPEDGNQQDAQSLESKSSDYLTNEEQYSSNDSDMMSFQDKEIVTSNSYSASRSGSTDMNTTTRSSATSFDRELIDFDEIVPLSADQQPRHTNQTFSSTVPPNAGNNYGSGTNVTKKDNPTVKTTFLKNIDSLYDRNAENCNQASSECPSVTTTASTLSPGSVSSNGSTEPTMHSNVGSYSMSSRFSIPLSTSNSSDINSNNGNGQMRGVAPTGSTDSLDRSFLDLNSNVSQMFHTMKGESANQVPKPREKKPVTGKAAGKENEKVVEKVKLVSVPVKAPKEKPVQKKQEIILTKVAAHVKPLEKVNDEITQYSLKGKEINSVLKEEEKVAVVKQNNVIDIQPMEDTKNEGEEKMKLQTIIEDKTSLSPPFLKEDLPTGKEHSSSTTQPFGVLETSKVVVAPLVTPHPTHEIAPAVHLSGDDAFTNYSANTKISAIEKLRQRKNGNAYAPPSVDATLQVKYFGHQRVVLKKQ